MSCTRRGLGFTAVALTALVTPWVAIAPSAAQTLPARMALVNAASEMAADASAEPVEPVVSFRRIFVPADAPQSWPTGGAQYLPLNREEFEQLVGAADAAQHPNGPARPRIAESTYRAKLAEGDALVGAARLRIKLPSPERGLLSLAPLNMAVTGASWEAAPERPPLIGAWARTGSAALEFAVAVDASDQLHLDWTAPPTSSAGQDLHYVLRLPRVVTQTFELTLPPTCIPSIEPSHLESKAPVGDGESTAWTFRLPAAAEHHVRIQRTGSPASGSLQPLAAVTEDYRLTAEGLDYEAEWRIEPRGPLSELRFDVPAAMEVIEIQADREPAAWQREVAVDGADAGRVMVPLSATAGPHTVRIKAASPLTLDQPWALPKIKATEAFWTEGTAALLVDPALELRGVATRSASLVNVLGVGAASTGEAYRVQQWNANAEIEAVIGRREPVVIGHSGAAIEFADRELVARSTIVLRSEQRRTFDLFATIQRYWNVEAVRAVPSGVLSTWHVEQEQGERTLQLQLRRWPTTDEPIVITIDGRKRTSRPIASATIDSLRWIQLPEVRMTDQWLAVRDRRGGKIIPSGALVDKVADVDALPTDMQQIAGAAAGAVVLNVAAADPLARVRVASRASQFEGEAHVQLIRTSTGFEHRVDVACRPIAGALDEALMTFSRPLPPDAAWQIDASGGQLIIARVNGADGAAVNPAASSAPQAGSTPATYRIQFGKPIAAPFSLRVAWRSEQQQSDSINAVAMPGADAWHSWAILRADPRQVRIRSVGFAPAAANPPARPDDPPAPVAACFRLSSDATPPPIETPSMEAIATTGTLAAGAAYCQFAELLTLGNADGDQVHEARFKLETRGAEQATFDLPEGMNVEIAQVDGVVAAAIERSSDAPHRIRVRLPRDRDELTLVLRMSAQATPLDEGAVVAPPWPGASFAILRGRWTLAVPPRYAVTEATEPSVEPGLFARLFGPLARRGQDAVWQLPAAFGAAAREDATAPPDHAGNLAGGRLILPQGWAVASQEFSRSPRPMRVMSIDGHRADWYALWLAFAAATAWLAGRRRRWAAAAAVLAAVGCLVLPPIGASLAQGAFLGILTGFVVRAVIEGVPQARIPGVSSAALAFAMIASSAALGSAADAIAAAGDAAAPPSVLMPIDADRQPAGDDVYVPADLLSELRAAAAGASPASAAAAITAARYELTLENQAQGEVDCTSGVLALRCETVRPEARLTLSLHQDDARWLNSRHTLDGRPIEIAWSEDGKNASVQLGDAGTNELRLHFAPRASSLANRKQAVLHVPLIPGAVVEVAHPFGMRDVTVESAAKIARQSSASRTVARLTAVDELTVSWPAIADRSAPLAVNVEQLTRLHVERAAAQVDVRLRIEGDAAPLEYLELATAAQLRLEPPGEDSPIQAVETAPGAPALVKLKFRSLQRLPLTLDLRFLVQRTVSTGRFTYPNVRVLRATTRRGHFAVSADPRLRTHDEPTSGLTPIAAAEIEELWGAAPLQSVAQYAVTTDSPQWSLSVEPAPPQFAAAESLDLLCQAVEAKFAYAAAVDNIDGPILMHEFIVSPQAAVENIVVSDQLEGQPMTSRWTRPEPDRICVFLGAPLSAAHVVNVFGSAPYNDANRLPIPRLAIQRARATTSELVLRRSSDAAVSWSGEGEPAAVLPARDDAGESALVVGRYAMPSAGGALGVLDVARNDVDWAADALVTLDMTAAQPTAQAMVCTSVASGVLDRLRLTASLDWKGPLRADGAEVTATVIPDEGRQLIEIRLAEPIPAGEHRVIRLVGDLGVAADRRLRMPQVRMLGAASPRTFVALPQSTGGQQSDWTLAGLRREELPRALRQTPEAAAAGAAYLALREQYIAEQRVFPNMMREPEAWMAATRGAIDAEGVLSAVAELLVQPGSADRCDVRLPPGAELLAAAVNDVPVVNLDAPQGRWQSPPGRPYLPRILTISYRQQLPAIGGDYRLEAVRAIVGGRELEAAQTLWQIDSVGARPGEVVAGTNISAAHYDVLLQQQLVGAATEASPLAFQLPSWESRAWFAPWLRRLPVAADAGAPWAKLRNEADRETVPPSTPRATTEGSMGTAWYQADERGDLVVAAPSNASWLIRWLAALAIIGAAAAIVRYPRRLSPIVRAARQWPHASVVLVGLTWWLALSPSALGLVIVGLSVASYLRSRWGGAKTAPAERGSVIATGVG